MLSEDLDKEYLLTSYLFIFCYELLSMVIYQRGINIGVPIINRETIINHMLYVGDILIMEKANIGAAKEIKKILKDY